jgi:hypothetical protein
MSHCFTRLLAFTLLYTVACIVLFGLALLGWGGELSAGTDHPRALEAGRRQPGAISWLAACEILRARETMLRVRREIREKKGKAA